MPNPIKVFYKGEHRDFLAFVESDDVLSNYQKDSSIPLSRVIAGGFKVYTPENGRGSEGILLEASELELDAEFHTKHVDEAFMHLVKEGHSKSVADVDSSRWTSTNDSYHDHF